MSDEDLDELLDGDDGEGEDEEEPEKIKAFKSFPADLNCRGFQYADGATFETGDPLILCESGFHACKYPEDLFYFYNDPTTVYYQVELVPEDEADKLVYDENSCQVISPSITLKECIGDREALYEYFVNNFNPDERAADPDYQYDDKFPVGLGKSLEIEDRFVRTFRSEDDLTDWMRSGSVRIRIGNTFRFVDGYTDAIWRCMDYRSGSWHSDEYHKTYNYTDYWFIVDPIEHHDIFDDFPIDSREMGFSSFKNTELQMGLNDRYTFWLKKALGRYLTIQHLDDDSDYYATVTLPCKGEVCKDEDHLDYMFPWFKKINIMDRFYDYEHGGLPYFGHAPQEYNYFWLRTPDDSAGYSFAIGDFGGFASYYSVSSRFRICPMVAIRVIPGSYLSDDIDYRLWYVPSNLRGTESQPHLPDNYE